MSDIPTAIITTAERFGQKEYSLTMVQTGACMKANDAQFIIDFIEAQMPGETVIWRVFNRE